MLAEFELTEDIAAGRLVRQQPEALTQPWPLAVIPRKNLYHETQTFY